LNKLILIFLRQSLELLNYNGKGINLLGTIWECITFFGRQNSINKSGYNT